MSNVHLRSGLLESGNRGSGQVFKVVPRSGFQTIVRWYCFLRCQHNSQQGLRPARHTFDLQQPSRLLICSIKYNTSFSTSCLQQPARSEASAPASAPVCIVRFTHQAPSPQSLPDVNKRACKFLRVIWSPAALFFSRACPAFPRISAHFRAAALPVGAARTHQREPRPMISADCM